MDRGGAAAGTWPDVPVNPRYPGATAYRDSVPATTPAPGRVRAVAPLSPPALPTGPALPRDTGRRVLRLLAAAVAWVVLVATTLWLAAGLAVSIEQYRLTYRATPAEVVAAEQTGTALPGCDLTLRVREGDRDVFHRAPTSGACHTRPKVGEKVTVQLPDNHDDRDIVLAGEESSNRITTAVASGIVTFGPTVLFGLPALAYLVLRWRRTWTQRRSVAASAPTTDAATGYCV